ncbi:MAG: peptide chain release factor 1 [Candidatus Omnitrophota bacterium]
MANKNILDKMASIEARYQELEQLLSDPKVIGDRAAYQKYAKEMADLAKVVNKYRPYKEVLRELEDWSKIASDKSQDPEFMKSAQKEIEELDRKKAQLLKELEESLLVEDASSDSDFIVEIRAATGGLEAGIFAADLYRMYTKFIAKNNWQVDLLSSHSTELGGFKEVIFGVKGKGAYKHLKFESGVHRVQRVPQTETSGRIHTSTATVAVLIEPKEVELEIDPKDLKIDVYRSSGPGGQSVNTTDSAVRITHLPTGLVITCQDERSQLKNKNKAMRVLRAKLLEKQQQENFAEIASNRRAQIGSGDRSEKIRTYNFPDRRITDHRINLTLYKFESVLEGDLDELTAALISKETELNA